MRPHLLIAILATMLFTAMVPFADGVLVLPSFKQAVNGIIVVAYAVTAMIALVRFLASERTYVAIVAATNTYCVPLVIANVGFLPGGILPGATPYELGVSVWCFVCWLFAYVIGALAIAFVERDADRRGPPTLARRYAPYVIAGPLAASLATIGCLAAFAERLPRIFPVGSSTHLPPVLFAVAVAFVVLTISALGALARLREIGGVTRAFLLSLYLLLLCGMSLVLNGQRFTVGWYYGMLVLTVSAWSVLGHYVKQGYERYHRVITSIDTLTESANEESIRFEQTVNSAAIGIVHLDDVGRIVFANERACSLFEATREELAAASLFDWIETTGELPPDLTGVPIEAMVCRHGETTRWLELRVSPPADRSYAIAAINDVTARKNAEDALIALNELKSQFIATMSHEIRTPLGGIVGVSELFRRTTPLTEKQRRFADTIDSSAQTLLRLVNDVLDFSKIEAAKLEIQRSSFDLPALLEGVRSTFAPAIAQKGLQLAVNAPERIDILSGDPLRLRQVLDNLVSNAVKRAQTGRITVTATEIASLDDTVRVRFRVEDTGAGIPPEQRDSIFEASGDLGLAIVKRLIELMGGSISFESDPERGTRFVVELPFERSSAGAFEPDGFDAVVPSNGAPTAHHSAGHPRRERILIAEDNEVNRMLVLAQLEELGFGADFVEDGAAAIAAAETGLYSLILMDSQMPHVDGLEATATIRRREAARGGHLPIICMTANAAPDFREECIAAGMDDYITKPVMLAALEGILERWLAAASA